jgi:hypothetical protein
MNTAFELVAFTDDTLTLVVPLVVPPLVAPQLLQVPLT